MKIVEKKDVDINLAERREIKYALPGIDVVKLRQLLKGSCRLIRQNKSVSLVQSIYFDDWSLRTCRANLSGLMKRQKLRLRWYDQELPGKNVFFEIKWRNNLLTGKHRFQIKSPNPIDSMPYRKIVDQIAEILPERFREMLLCYQEPIVIVKYKREHFSSFDGRMRLTLDYDIKFYDQIARAFPTVSSLTIAMPDLVVLEGKGAIGEEKSLPEILFPFQPRVTRSSKYVLGCQAFDMI